jgi:hypothetical protein
MLPFVGLTLTDKFTSLDEPTDVFGVADCGFSCRRTRLYQI